MLRPFRSQVNSQVAIPSRLPVGSYSPAQRQCAEARVTTGLTRSQRRHSYRASDAGIHAAEWGSDMRSILGFLSLLALGLMIAVALAIAGGSLSAHWPGLNARHPGEFRLDYPSLVLGLAVGMLMATLARMSWAEMPRRLALWLLANERNFYRMGMAAVCLGVLVFY